MKYKILTVDDSKVIRKILKQSLSKYNCSLYESSNGREGLKVALEVKPDLIILDIDMPVMNGWDTLASLRFSEELKDTPVIMLTANAEEKNKDRADALGVVEFIAKPFQSQKIIKHINNIMALSSD